MNASLYVGKEVQNTIVRRNERSANIGSTWCLGIAAAVFFCSCSTTTPPTNRLTRAELSIQAAEEARAADLAPVDLQNAREKLAKARQALTEEKYTEARRLAESAQIDAQLAEAKADTTIMREAADQILRERDRPPTQAELESRKPLTSGPENE